MKINSLQFNFIYPKPQSAVSSPLRMCRPLNSDTCSFTGIFNRNNKGLEDLVPKHKGLIYEKIRDENGNITERRPVEVDIIKDTPGTFLFMRDKETVGELSLSYISNKECNENGRLYKNYKSIGLVGDRIDVNFVENKQKEKYGGIAHLADLIEVACCKEMGFKPNVISYSVREAAPLHYLRGKRFIPFKEYEPYYYSYYGKNPDEIMEDIIKNTPEGEEFDTVGIQHPFLMYMPKDMAKELEKELKEHPIF